MKSCKCRWNRTRYISRQFWTSQIIHITPWSCVNCVNFNEITRDVSPKFTQLTQFQAIQKYHSKEANCCFFYSEISTCRIERFFSIEKTISTFDICIVNWVRKRVGCLGLGLGVRVRGKKRFTNRNPKFLVPKFGIIPFFLKFLVPKFGVFPFFLKGSFAN